MKSILVVDDHSDIRRLIRITLGDQFQVYEAEDGAGGLECVRALKPDLVILDVMMPGEYDGFSVLRAIKSDPLLSGTAVVMLTARGQQADREDGLREGADAYIVKPFSPLKLVGTLRGLLAA